MRMVAVAWQVYLITGSSVAVGIIGLVEVVPLIAFSIIGGSIADSMDRRKLMRWMQSGLMVSSLGLALVSLTDEPSVLWLYGFTAFSSALMAADGPARSATMVEVVSKKQLSAAVALRQVVFQITMLIGPVLGGVMIASFDLSFVYLIDALTFVATLVSLSWVPANHPEGTSSSRLESIREGLKFTLRTPVLVSIFAIDLVAMIFGMPRAVFPELAEKTFGLGASGLGLLYAAPAAGAVIAALTTGWVSRIRRQGIAVLVSVVVWGSAIAFAGLSIFSLPLTLFFLVIAGGADVISAVFRNTMLQSVTPPPLLGRANAAYLMVVTGGPRLGDVEAGLAAGLIGAQGSVVLGGAVCLVGAALIGFKMPVLRRYRDDA
jgi:Bacterial protein of unknown function (DUF894).